MRPTGCPALHFSDSRLRYYWIFTQLFTYNRLIFCIDVLNMEALRVNRAPLDRSIIWVDYGTMGPWAQACRRPLYLLYTGVRHAGFIVFLASCCCFMSLCSHFVSLCGCFTSLCGCFLTFCGVFCDCGCFASLCGHFMSPCSHFETLHGCFATFCSCESLCVFLHLFVVVLYLFLVSSCLFK